MTTKNLVDTDSAQTLTGKTISQLLPLFATTQTPQAQGTTLALGANGGQGGSANPEQWSCPTVGTIFKCVCSCVNTPAVGQTRTFNLKNDAVTIATGVIVNGSFGVTLTISLPNVNEADALWIESINSATSGSSNLRCFVLIKT